MFDQSPCWDVVNVQSAVDTFVLILYAFDPDMQCCFSSYVLATYQSYSLVGYSYS